MSNNLIGTYVVTPYNYIKVKTGRVERLTIEKQVFRFTHTGIKGVRSFVDDFSLLENNERKKGKESGAITQVSETRWTGVTTPEPKKLTLIFELNKLSPDKEIYQFTGTGFNPDRSFSTSFKTIMRRV